MSVLLASSVVDSSPQTDRGTGKPGSDGDDGAESRPDDPWLDEWDDDEYISDDDDPPGDDEDEGGDDDDGPDDPPGDDDDPPEEGERPPDDPWLDEWDDDEYISDDDDPPGDDEDEGGDDDDGPDGPPGDDDDPPEESERPPDDPWLDEWDDDEYISSDSLGLALARAENDEALHVLGSGDRLGAGEGGVYVLGDWIEAASPAVIAGFEPGTDRLIYAYAQGAGIPEITLADTAEAGGAVLLVDGQAVLRLDGGAAPQADEVLLYPVNLDQAAHGAGRGLP